MTEYSFVYRTEPENTQMMEKLIKLK